MVETAVLYPAYIVQLLQIGLSLAHVRAQKEGSHVALLLQVVDDVTDLYSELDADLQTLTGHVRAHLHEEEAARETEQQHHGQDAEEQGDALLFVEVAAAR